MNLKMNLVTTTVVIFLLVTSFIHAQETQTIKTDSTKNLYSIQFYLVNGLSVAGKKQLSDNSALRLHLDFSADLTSIT